MDNFTPLHMSILTHNNNLYKYLLESKVVATPLVSSMQFLYEYVFDIQQQQHHTDIKDWYCDYDSSIIGMSTEIRSFSIQELIQHFGTSFMLDNMYPEF